MTIGTNSRAKSRLMNRSDADQLLKFVRIW
jgi:hypothetical protein